MYKVTQVPVNIGYPHAMFSKGRRLHRFRGLLQMAATFTLSEQLSQTGGGGAQLQQQRNGIQAKMHIANTEKHFSSRHVNFLELNRL